MEIQLQCNMQPAPELPARMAPPTAAKPAVVPDNANPSLDTQGPVNAPVRERNGNAFIGSGQPDRSAPKDIIRKADDSGQTAAGAPDQPLENNAGKAPESSPAFNKVLAAVVQNNKAAGSEKTNAPSQGETNPAQAPSDDAAALLATLNALGMPAMIHDAIQSQNGDAADTNSLDLAKLAALLNGVGGKDVAGQATDVIKQALAVLAAALKVKTVGSLDNVQTIAPTDQNAAQFAEILAALKAISGQLDSAATQAQSLDIGRALISASDVKPLAQLMHTEIFKIEVALKALGLGKPVAEKLAELNQQPMSASDLVTALPPARQSIPLYQAQQITAQQNEPAPADSMDSMLQRLAALLQKNNVAAAAVVAPTDVTPGDAKNGANSAAQPQAGAFDAKVYRALLKIESADSTASENKAAARDQAELNLLKNGQIPMARGLADANAAAQSNTSLFENLLRDPGAGASQIVKNAAPPPPTPDQSVITQIADKLTSAVRTGVMEVRLTLRPESLGEVHIKIRVDGDIVSTRINVENQQVKQIVESNFSHLKDALSQQHLQSGSFEVSVTGGAQQRLAEGGQRQDNPAAAATDGDNIDKEDSAAAQDIVAGGVDTGRRFGTNTVEFYV
ncbi:MAG: flagellar hook-length control protein FliK [Chitinivibrionales bacterium]|nr:flagellar hook-length control protein FliK [Chitinivibrionales bacterium]